MFRKVSHIVLALLLLTSTMGLTLSAQYCHETHESISVLADPASCCDVPADCCSDEVTTCQIDNDFTFSSFQFDTKPVFSFILYYSDLLVEEPTDKDFPISSFIEPPTPTVHQVLSRIQVYIL